MYTDNRLEQDYAQQVSLEHRKKFAQFFTPWRIAELMASWLLEKKDFHTVLEPAFGLGVFTRALLSRKDNIRIKGFEVDDLIFEKAVHEFARRENVSLLKQDYLYNDWQNQYDGIICNPPYFKFHDYDNKNALQEIESNLKCKLNGFTNLYTLFLLKSIQQLKPGGRCAYIIPSEFLNSDYGKQVKAHLLKTGTLRHIIVIDFEENIFHDALTTASIILCANDKMMDSVRFTYVRSLHELNSVGKMLSGDPNADSAATAYCFSELNPDVKWKAYYQPQNGNKFKNLVPFSTFAKVVRGIATGANHYFTFNLSKARQHSIDERYLLPCVCKAVDVKGHFFAPSDFEKLKHDGKNIFLLNVRDDTDPHVMKYLQKGEGEQVDKKYLTASRNPWYALENRPPSPIWVSVFNRTGLRFVRNTANVSNLTTFHCVYPKKQFFSEVSTDLLFAYLLTDTAREIFDDNSREYGNGLQKFEPNDLNKGQMLDLSVLSHSGKTRISELYHQYAKDTDKRLIGEMDEVFKTEYTA